MSSPRTTSASRRLSRAAALGLALGIAAAPTLLLVAGSAEAAPAPVTIVYGDLNGFQPQTVNIANRGFVRWTNSGATSVTIGGHSPVCKFTVTVAGFATSKAIGPFPYGGRCDYTGVTVLATNQGAIIVGPRPGPTGSPTPTRTPAPSATATATTNPTTTPPSPGTTGSPQPVASASASTTPGPSLSASTNPGATPIAANPPPSAGGPQLRTDGVYIGRSPHRAVGLLAAVSATLLAGLVAGLLRVLLAEPECGVREDAGRTV